MIIKPIDFSKVNIPVYLSIKYQFHFGAMPKNVYDAIVSRSRTKSIIVYEFYMQLGGKIEPMAFVVTSLSNKIIEKGVATGNFVEQKNKILKYCVERLREGVKVGSCSC